MDAVAHRTRARCRGQQEPVEDRRRVENAIQLNRTCARRGRLKKVAPSASGKERDWNNSPATPSVSEQDGSSESNGLQSNEANKKVVGPRARRQIVVSSPSTSTTSEDSDVVIVGEFQSNQQDDVVSEPQAKRPCLSAAPKYDTSKPASETPEDDLDDDEELRIMGVVGQVVTRDLPHPRPDCAEHRFRREDAAAESNARCCDQCYCYVCDVKASECKFWGTGHRERDHANARSHPAWNVLRRAARAGDTSLVRREFEESGPLRTPTAPLSPTPTPTPTPMPGLDLLRWPQQAQSQTQPGVLLPQQQRHPNVSTQQLLAQIARLEELRQQQREQQQQQQQRRRRRGRARQELFEWDLLGGAGAPEIGAIFDDVLAAMTLLSGHAAARGSGGAGSGVGDAAATQRTQQQQQQQHHHHHHHHHHTLPLAPGSPLPPLPPGTPPTAAPPSIVAAALPDPMRPGPPPQYQAAAAPHGQPPHGQPPHAADGGGLSAWLLPHQSSDERAAPQQSQQQTLAAFQPFGPLFHPLSLNPVLLSHPAPHQPPQQPQSQHHHYQQHQEHHQQQQQQQQQQPQPQSHLNHQQPQYQPGLLQPLQQQRLMAPGPPPGLPWVAPLWAASAGQPVAAAQQGPPAPPGGVGFPQPFPVPGVTWAYSGSKGPMRLFPIPQ